MCKSPFYSHDASSLNSELIAACFGPYGSSGPKGPCRCDLLSGEAYACDVVVHGDDYI